MNQPRATRIKAGDRVSVTTSTLLPSGEALGTTEDGLRAIRVYGAFPFEDVIARVDHVGKNATFATALEISRGRMGRRSIPCDNHIDTRGKCTGCPLMGAREPDQRAMLREMLEHEWGLVVSEVIAAPKQLGYRMSAKRVAFGGLGRLRLGSYQRGTNKPAGMEACLVDHPRISAAADELAEVCRELKIPAHFSEAKSGVERGVHSVWLRTNGQATLVTLVASHDDAEKDARRIADRVSNIDGLFVSVTSAEGGSLRGADPVHIAGIESFDYEGQSGAQTIGPMAFFQPNPAVIDMAYDALCAPNENTKLVFDLYAGSGATTARLMREGVEVVPVESNEESARALSQVVGRDVSPESAEAFFERETRTPDLIVANPPRRGLGKTVCDSLVKIRAQTVRIMACGPGGLKKDIARLSDAYGLSSLSAYATLPQTMHLELVAELTLKTA